MLLRYFRHFTVNLSAYRFYLAYGTKSKSKRKQTKKFYTVFGRASTIRSPYHMSLLNCHLSLVSLSTVAVRHWARLPNELSMNFENEI